MSDGGPSVHASAVKVGPLAVLIRGPSGAGKSRLAFDLIMAGRSGVVESAVLVGDDRVHLATVGHEIAVRPAPLLAGLIEPPPESLKTTILGVEIPRIPVRRGDSPLPLVVAALTTTKS